MNVALASRAATWLFVPGSSPNRFSKARASGADVVILDLEDAVPPQDKGDARSAVVAETDAGDSAGQLAVRINAPGTPWFEGDVEALRGRPVTLVVPKSESPDALRFVAEAVPDGNVVGLIETARGIRASWELAAADGVVRLALGHLDLAAQLGIDPEQRDALLWARSTLVAASAAGGIAPPVDGVTTTLGDPARTAADAAYAQSLGFAGKLLIHPEQVAPAQSAFRPAPAAVAWARRVQSVAAGSVGVVDGEMVDAPVIARAARILALAGES